MSNKVRAKAVRKVRAASKKGDRKRDKEALRIGSSDVSGVLGGDPSSPVEWEFSRVDENECSRHELFSSPFFKGWVQ